MTLQVLNLISIIIMAIATVLLAVFTWRIWKISNEQHRLYHDPDLAIYSLSGVEEDEEPFSSGSIKDAHRIGYAVMLINPGTIPVIVRNIKETLITEGIEDYKAVFATPSGLEVTHNLITDFPAVVGGGESSIYHGSCKLSDIPENTKAKILGVVRIRIEYQAGERIKFVNRVIPLHLTVYRT